MIDECVICRKPIGPEDSGLCDQHKYDEQPGSPVRKALEAILALHSPCPQRTPEQKRRLQRAGLWENWQPWCEGCSDGYAIDWPCETAQLAMDGLGGPFPAVLSVPVTEEKP